MTNRAKTAKSTKPQPKMSKWGFMLYPVYNQKGQLIWVSVPEREEN